MTEAEISDFEVYKESVESRGSIRRYFCKATLTKPNAKISLDTQIMYDYEGSWLLQPFVITAKVESVDIEGKWNGTYTGTPYSGKASLDIEEVTEDGKVKGVYSYTPDTITKNSQAGSYKVSGTIDMTSLTMKLEAGDWVVKDSSALSVTKIDITAVIDVENAEIEGLGQETSPFVVKK